MPEVPFDRIGPGQVGRIAYQVLGQDGPVLNPRNIRYMSPDRMGDIQAADPSSFDWGAGVAGLSLAISVANLAVSAKIAAEVSRLHKKLDFLQETVERTEVVVEEILRKVSRIDTNVAENNLRHAVKHVCAASCSENQIDVVALAQLFDDLMQFLEAAETPILLDFKIRLSSDVRGNLGGVWSFLHQLRFLVARKHNILVGGDPRRSVWVSAATDYISGDLDEFLRAAIGYDRLAKTYQEMSGQIVASVGKRFTWSGQEDLDYFSEMLEQLGHAIDEIYQELMPIPSVIYRSLPEKTLAEEDNDKLVEQLRELTQAWVWGTDSGLIHRTLTELEGVKMGYEETFWPHLVGAEPEDRDTLQIVSELP